ncbi:uncharacterized protein LOC119965920 isoform X2 [Scyliorhinus canicula]|uniref:uncharacterized protein LOC119965920 isoform X2 n=1 Tax=Scyliorhinus canicula TaxID=7830 RepID=UPI0018F681B0|nr:uncharacterized protein LOC119965920 isoform X2 [Scyliorhinus canicula]
MWLEMFFGLSWIRHDVLQQPLIIQNTALELSVVYLVCLVDNKEITATWWHKKGHPLQSDETYKMSNDNRTLIVNTKQQKNCELYTCVIKNKVSQEDNSHLLIIDELLFLHEISFMASVLAVVSTSTSFAVECYIIFFAIRIYRAYKQLMQLTSAFILFQIIAFIFLLMAALFCIFDPAYPIAYRIIEGIGFLFVSTTIIYILFLFVKYRNILQRPFLRKKGYHIFFLLYGIFSVIISAVPIYRGQQNITECQVLVRDISGTIAATVVIYVFIVGILLVFFLKYMMSWKVQRAIRVPSSWKVPTI